MVTHTHTHTYIHIYIHTYTQDNYSNPRCAHARRGLIILYNYTGYKTINFSRRPCCLLSCGTVTNAFVLIQQIKKCLTCPCKTVGTRIEPIGTKFYGPRGHLAKGEPYFKEDINNISRADLKYLFRCRRTGCSPQQSP